MMIVVLIYSGNILVGSAMNDLPPFTIAFFRLLVAFLIILPIGFKSMWKNRETFRKYKWPLLLLTLTGVTFFNTLIYSSLQFTSATHVSILEAAIPVFTVILSAAILKERLRLVQWLGIVMSLIGSIWVITGGNIFQLFQANWNIGDAIMMGAVLSWAVYSIAVKRYMYLFPTFGVLVVMMGISLVLVFPILLLEWSIIGIPSLASPEYMSGFLFLGIFPSIIALVLYNRAVDSLGASKTSVFLNLLPLVTMIGAYFWLGESITMVHIFGAIIVILGVIVTTQTREKLPLDKMEEGRASSSM